MDNVVSENTKDPQKLLKGNDNSKVLQKSNGLAEIQNDIRESKKKGDRNKGLTLKPEGLDIHDNPTTEIEMNLNPKMGLVPMLPNQ